MEHSCFSGLNFLVWYCLSGHPIGIVHSLTFVSAYVSDSFLSDWQKSEEMSVALEGRFSVLLHCDWLSLATVNEESCCQRYRILIHWIMIIMEMVNPVQNIIYPRGMSFFVGEES